MQTVVFSNTLTRMLSGRSGGAMLNATGTFSGADNAEIGTFNNQKVFVKVVNGKLNAYTYDSAGGPLVFKPGHWLFAAGLLSAADAGRFSQTDPSNGVYYAPPSDFTGSRTGESGTGGGTTPPPSTGGGGTTPPPTTGGGGTNPGGTTGFLPGLTGGGGTNPGGQTQPMNILVIVLIVAAVGGLVFFLAKKK